MNLKNDNGRIEIWVAVIGGIFAIIAAVISSDYFFPPKQPKSGNETRTPPASSYHNSISKAIKELGATNGNSYDLGARLSAIRSLQTIGITAPETDIKKMITSEIQRYIRSNIMDRKSKGEGIQEDRGTYRADDIVASLEALQAIRRSSGNMIKIDLSRINFDRVNLVKFDLEGFYFAFSRFQYAFLSGSKMKGADFSLGDLSYAAIWNADMSNANFHKVSLQGTKFANVQLGGSNIEQAKDKNVALFGVKGLRKDQIAQFPRFDGK